MEIAITILFFLYAGSYTYTTDASEISRKSFSDMINLLTAKGSLNCDTFFLVCKQPKAYATGYSSQPGNFRDVKQKKPPDAISQMVESLGYSELMDVPPDDIRWKGRESREVYSQKNEKSLSFYWPRGGVLNFDISAILGNLVKQHDYLFSKNCPSTPGDFIIKDVKQQVSFRASGNNVIPVFVQEDKKSVSTEQFFKFYVEPKRDMLPAHRIYPMGQKMMISMYNPRSVAEIKRMAAHGFTAAGIWENAWGVGFDLDAIVKSVREKRMRTWLSLPMGRNSRGELLTAVYGTCNALKDGMRPKEIGEKTKLIFNKYTKGDFAATVDAWMHFPEEMGTRLDDFNDDRCSRNQLLAVNNASIDAAMSITPIAPLIKSETNSYKLNSTDFNAVHGRISAPVRQFYFSGYKDLDVLPKYIDMHKKLVANLEAKTKPDRPGIDKRIIGVIHDYSRDAAIGNNQRFTDYYVTTSLIKGVQSFSLVEYARYNQDPLPKKPSQKLKTAWFNTFKAVTECGIDDAMLWGTDNPPGGKLKFEQIDGPEKSIKYEQPAMLAAERQYEKDRYVLVSNSHKNSSITVRISNLPHSYRIRDCKTGSVAEMREQSVREIPIPAYGSVIYKFSEGDI